MKKSLCAFAFALASIGGSAGAATVQISVHTKIADTTVPEEIGELSVDGTFSFKTSLNDQNPDPVIGLFSPISFEGIIKGFNYSIDEGQINASTNGGFNLSAIPVIEPSFGTDFTLRYVQLLTSGWGLEADGSLPGSLDVDDLSVATLSLGFRRNFDGSIFGVRQVTPKSEIETSVVPLPASLPLFLAGLGGLGWVAKRRKQS